MRDIDRFRGCIAGGAIGDALGYPVEFEDAEGIFDTYGKKGIRDYVLRRGVAQISDDTQMTLFTAAGLLRAAAMGRSFQQDRAIINSVYRSYQDWYGTQLGLSRPAKGESGSWLATVPALYSRRAPGSTCINALARGQAGSIAHPINDSKGCGGIMRAAPVGLIFNDIANDEDERLQVDLLGAETAALTHGHQLGYMPAAALTHIIQRLAQDGWSIRRAVEDSMEALELLFTRSQNLHTLLALLRKALDLASGSGEDLENIEHLGEGWVAEETIAIAVYCAVRYPQNFRKAVTASVNHSGDSDSTGAVTGNIMGASLGCRALPKPMLDRLELQDVILRVAEDLYNAYAEDGNREWRHRYIGKAM